MLPSTPPSGRPWQRTKKILDVQRCYQAYHYPDSTMVIRGLPPAIEEPDPGVELGVEDGLLCQLLHSPEFNLFPNSAVFESNFIQIHALGATFQVTKYNNWRNIYDSSTTVALGVTSSVPCLPLPNILLMAKVKWPKGQSPKWICPIEMPTITLKRILPLKFVELQVCDWSQRILRVRTVAEKMYYLKLHIDHPEVVFQFWVRLLCILDRGLSITTKDPRIHVPHCLVPKVCKSSGNGPEALENSKPLPAGPSESLALLMARGMSEASKRPANLTHHKKPVRTTDINLMEIIRDIQARNPEQECSSQENIQRNKGNLCLRDSFSHSMWERENPSGLQSLSLLSTLAASIHCFGPQS
ncbi:protein FAM71F1-like [Gracilinanus agilis]|uniref:protein FAM71F1-like n=1 Tax=Gracilinanus agilis TaxID=191870 RepID=UPI001CFCC788|nr:protein FAM71F1-like [Gracilinanus agilis]